MAAQVLGGPKKTVIHQTKRRQVLASADVALRQVNVIDNEGKEHVSFVWACGPDVMLSETMDGMFDVNRRRRAPKWLVEQLQTLPMSRQFDFRGKPKSGAESTDEAIDMSTDAVAEDKDEAFAPA